MCSGGLEGSSKHLLCGSASSDGVLTRRETSPDDVKAKILDLKVELDSLTSEPGSTESKPEVLHRAPCTGEVPGAVDTKPESSRVADYCDSGEDKTDDQQCSTCAVSSQMTSEVDQGTAGFRTKTKTKAELLEADASIQPPTLEQSCGPADRTEHLAASGQHQDAGLATPGHNMIFEYVTFYTVVQKP